MASFLTHARTHADSYSYLHELMGLRYNNHNVLRIRPQSIYMHNTYLNYGDANYTYCESPTHQKSKMSHDTNPRGHFGVDGRSNS
jgi:hypothetical protein